MLTERMQLVLSPEQRGRLEEEAARLGVSVASLVRDAIDAHLGPVSSAERERAVADLGRLRGRFLAPEELEALIAEERAAGLAAAAGPR